MFSFRVNLFLVISVLGIFENSIVNSKLLPNYFGDIDFDPRVVRVVRSADEADQDGSSTIITTTSSPSQIGDEAEILEKIRRGITRLRHAEDRLKQFVDKIETGIETKRSNVNPSEDTSDKNGQSGAGASDGEIVDFHKLVAAYKDKSPQSFPALIKRISDDTHILLDQLHGRLDAVGQLRTDKPHEADDKSAEDHHKNPSS